MSAVVTIKVNNSLFLRDPEETELGRKIVGDGIKLMSEIGYENFTFKKLAEKIDSTEASVYRYFESKNKFLNYIKSWYWGWVEYLINHKTSNMNDPKKKLKVVIDVIVDASVDDPSTAHIDEAALHRIIVSESAKAYITTQMKADSREGVYRSIEEFANNVSKIIKEVNPHYRYPKSLLATIVVTAHRFMFYLEHGIKATELQSKRKGEPELVAYLEHLAFGLLGEKAR